MEKPRNQSEHIIESKFKVGESFSYHAVQFRNIIFQEASAYLILHYLRLIHQPLQTNEDILALQSGVTVSSKSAAMQGKIGSMEQGNGERWSLGFHFTAYPPESAMPRMNRDNRTLVLLLFLFFCSSKHLSLIRFALPSFRKSAGEHITHQLTECIKELPTEM